MIWYCKFEKFSRGLYFCETSHMQSFVKIKPSRNGNITLSFFDIGKSCHNREFFTSLMCLLMHFAKIKFSRKFQNLQYQIMLLFNPYPVNIVFVQIMSSAYNVCCIYSKALLNAVAEHWTGDQRVAGSKGTFSGFSWICLLSKLNFEWLS